MNGLIRFLTIVCLVFQGYGAEAAEGGAPVVHTDFRVLEAGNLLVKLPAHGVLESEHVAPGPLLGLARKPESASETPAWIGTSRLFSPHRAIRSLRTEPLGDGSAQAPRGFRIAYTFEGGARYTVWIQEGAFADGVWMDEEISGIPAGDELRVESAWIDFNPTFRRFPTARGHVERSMMAPLDGLLYGPSAGDWREEPNVEMAGRVRPCNPINRLGSYASFRNVNTGRSLGILARSGWHDRPRDADLPVFRAAPPITFHYTAGVLHWSWPLRTGRRFSAVVLCNDPKGDRVAVLSERWGGIDARRRDAWRLTYPAEGRRPSLRFPGGPLPNPLDELLGDVTGRNVYYRLIHGYSRSLPVMKPADRARVDAHILRAAYRCADQPFPPLIDPGGAWAPGEAADHMGILPAAAFFLPEHAMAAEWLDQYEKFIELSAYAGTEGDGGDWRGAKMHGAWAFLRAAAWGNFLGRETDGRNRFANPWLTRFGEACVTSLTAPVDERRRLAPWGRVGDPAVSTPPFELRLLGHGLRRYRPLAAEHLLWAVPPFAEPFGRPAIGWRMMGGPNDANRGTPPELRSAIHPGQGVILRAGVGTAKELSIHLSLPQGAPAPGGAGHPEAGAIAYCAAGRLYGGRIVDSRPARRHDFRSTFQVLAGGVYHGTACRAEEMRLQDLEIAQCAVPQPARGPAAPDAELFPRRAVMLVGSDYLLVKDHVGRDAPSRFTWAVPRGGTRPLIRMLGGEGSLERRDAPPGSEFYVRENRGGDSLALVSHRRELEIKATSYGARVRSPEWEDRIFFQTEASRVRGWGVGFDGRRGLLRRRRGGDTELVLFEGRSLRTRSVTLEIEGDGTAMSLRLREGPEGDGWFVSQAGGHAALTFRHGLPDAVHLYLDGAPHPSERKGKTLRFQVPAGRGRWQVTARNPPPAAPVVLRVEHETDGARLYFRKVPGATAYRVECSRDAGQGWQRVVDDVVQGDEDEASVVVRGGAEDAKLHVRVTAMHPHARGMPSPAYPVYLERDPPQPPDGLRCFPMQDRVRITWGEVLGVEAYGLYRRTVGDAAEGWRLIFRGRATEFTDGEARGAIPPFSAPGAVLNADRPYGGIVYDYAVSAVNGNGEGPRCRSVTTHPANWLNWYPAMTTH